MKFQGNMLKLGKKGSGWRSNVHGFCFHVNNSNMVKLIFVYVTIHVLDQEFA